MPLVLPNSVYLHCPKTGGNFVRKCIDQLGLQHRNIDRPHDGYAKLPAQFRRRFVFTFVRNPETWFKSFWSYRMIKPNPRAKHPPFDTVMHQDFNRFVQQCADRFPGALTQLFERFTGWPIAVDFVGRHENLRDDLETALTMARERYRPAVIRTLPIVNVAGAKRHEKLSPSVRRVLRKSEATAYERYGYD